MNKSRRSLCSLLLSKVGENPKSLIIPLSFALPVFIFYFLEPVFFSWTHAPFDRFWKGRAPLLMFLWLLVLEAILSWKKLSGKLFESPTWLKYGATSAVAAAPTVYAVSMIFFGLYHPIQDLGEFLGVPFKTHGSSLIDVSWPLSFEYLLFGVLLTLLSFLLYKAHGLRYFSISIFYIFAVGAFYTIDTFYPEGEATVLQATVPIIVNSVAWILKPMGYIVHYVPESSLMTVTRPGGYFFPALIYWPCAGVYSMGIYSIVILLFLKEADISLMGKIVYFIVGAIGTFFVNVLRIATICKLGVDEGQKVADLFHTYYGELFFIVWIIVYLLIIIGSHKLCMKLSEWKNRSNSSLTQDVSYFWS